MKAISLWQPWASAVALGLKRNETRSWHTRYRGPLAIHAARKSSPEIKDFFQNVMLMRGDIQQPFHQANLYSFVMLPKGAIIAFCELEWCKPAYAVQGMGDVEAILGDYSCGRYVWGLNKIQPLAQPYFIQGHQGLFDIPDHIKPW